MTNLTTDHIVGFIDLGTNSVRLLLALIRPNHSYTVLSQQKEMVRLGEGEFADDVLQPQAMARAALVCRKFAEMARANGATEIVAVATAATREAHNQRELLQRIQAEAGMDLRVISGREEARLIYLGVVSGEHLGNADAAFIDIGGGSTEVILGNQHAFHELESMKAGAIRLTNLLLSGETGPVSAARYEAIRKHVRSAAVRFVQRARAYTIRHAFGSSGTIENLAAIAARELHKRRPRRRETLTHADLRRVAELLCSLTVEERRKLGGINPERADIIVAGAAILDVLMTELGLAEITVSHRSLREGLLVDYLDRTETAPTPDHPSVRAQSVLRLGRICAFDEAHARQVARLSGMLFDSARREGLHALGEWERELLEYAALLHDIGTFLSYSNHHAHGYYFINNADLLGFDQTELAIIATTVLFHRKVLPRKRHAEFAALDARAQHVVQVLCVLLRLAESLDRSHAGLVRTAEFAARGRRQLRLGVECGQDCQLELWGTQGHAATVEKIFGRQLQVGAK